MSETQYKMPVIIEGRLKAYSENTNCLHINHQWTCYFLPVSRCQEEMIKTGKRVRLRLDMSSYGNVPAALPDLEYSYWWGVVQSYMFRLQPNVLEYINGQMLKMDNGKGFPSHTPIAGIHVRHGDKHVDGFRDQSFHDELRAVRKSPDCYLVNDVCYENVTSSSMDNQNQSSFNSTSGIRKLPIFVASDDEKVLTAARELGYLENTAGFSQQNPEIGVSKALASITEFRYQASMEIISDIYLLSRCSTLVGIAASQVFRMSVAMSNVTGTLTHAVAMDHDQIPRVKHMSNKYHVIYADHFSLP